MLARFHSPWFAGEHAFRPLFDLAFSPPFQLGAPSLAAGPQIDIVEKESGVELVCDVPGARPEDVSVTVEKGMLTIHAQRKTDYGEGSVRRAERYRGEIMRSFRMGDAYDLDQISATLQNGVLVVKVPKRPQAEPKKIPIAFGADPAAKQLGERTEETA